MKLLNAKQRKPHHSEIFLIFLLRLDNIHNLITLRSSWSSFQNVSSCRHTGLFRDLWRHVAAKTKEHGHVRLFLFPSDPQKQSSSSISFIRVLSSACVFYLINWHFSSHWLKQRKIDICHGNASGKTICRQQQMYQIASRRYQKEL